MKKIWMAVVLVFLLVQGTYASAADSQQLEISLQLDNSKVIINGVESEGEAPYREADTTLVPMRIITTAFGATLTWDGETQGITLKSGNTVIDLQIDSQDALVNGSPQKLDAAPRLKNDTTMVPVRFIAETFGAKVGFDPETSTVTITGAGAVAEGNDDSTEMNIDAGKTGIGSSYYSWSMKYPSGLVKNYISFSEDYVYFEDAKGEYSLSINVDEDQDFLSNDALLKRITDEMGSDETVLDKRIVKEAGVTYAKLVTKWDSSYWEVRLYQANDSLYTLHFNVEKEEDFKNAEKNKGYQDLLNSFTTSFDGKDSTIKDLSTVKNGLRAYQNDEIGIKANLPAKWNMYKDNGQILFEHEEETESFGMRMTSTEDGDTLDKWVQREYDFLTTEYVSSNFTIKPAEDLRVSGIAAKQLKYSLKMGNTWYYVYDTYLFKGGYKYEFVLSSKNEKNGSELIQSLLQSIELSDKINSSTGYIHDEKDFVDRTKLEEQRYKSKNFAIKTPIHWNQYENKSNNIVNYESNLMNLSIAQIDSMTLDQVKRLVESSFKKNEELLDNYKIVSTTTEKFANEQATKIVVNAQYEDAQKFKLTTYLFSHNNKVYIVEVTIRDEVATTANLDMINEVLKSFRFLE